MQGQMTTQLKLASPDAFLALTPMPWSPTLPYLMVWWETAQDFYSILSSPSMASRHLDEMGRGGVHKGQLLPPPQKPVSQEPVCGISSWTNRLKAFKVVLDPAGQLSSLGYEEAMQNITGGKRCTAERDEIREYDYAGILCNLNCRKVISSPALECLLLMGATLSQ
ncbi:hypothetical protein llap_11969 [Limosa lapponica baueri]|uniref:Uncharacterized protein n=1 Tax=Limosa lapponica baueri TaxID=1758121 RepID=A0A2I0TV85_LIMLA|nr:hypothetical protein llap_11969 [Limosa lapponica baueri]